MNKKTQYKICYVEQHETHITRLVNFTKLKPLEFNRNIDKDNKKPFHSKESRL